MTQHVALLRGINVGGNRKLPMADLRTLAAELELDVPRTYVASGNLVFGSSLKRDRLEARLERAIQDRFGFSVDVMVRSDAEWSAYRAANPFPAESEATPNFVMLCIGKAPPTDAEVEALRARAADNERVEVRGDAIWIWFGNGAGRSKIGSGPAKSVWTTRNWRTVIALDEMMQDSEAP
jgi:uncharacterized protein (DUF1697 family)